MRALEHVPDGAGDRQRDLVQRGLEKCEHSLRRRIGPDSRDGLLESFPRIIESMKDDVLQPTTRELCDGAKGSRVELDVSDDRE